MNPEDYAAKPIQNTSQMVKQWHYIMTAIQRVKAELSRLEQERVDAENKLGAWVVPPDGKAGETFNVWFGSGVIAAHRSMECGKNITYNVYWRVMPSQKQLGDM